MITLSWLFIITVLAAGFALFDAISRLRGRYGASVLAIVELVVAILLLISLFLTDLPVSITVLAIILEVVLIILLVLRGSGRRSFSTLTLIALILNTIVVLLALDVIRVPALQ